MRKNAAYMQSIAQNNACMQHVFPCNIIVSNYVIMAFFRVGMFSESATTMRIFDVFPPPNTTMRIRVS